MTTAHNTLPFASIVNAAAFYIGIVRRNAINLRDTLSFRAVENLIYGYRLY